MLPCAAKPRTAKRKFFSLHYSTLSRDDVLSPWATVAGKGASKQRWRAEARILSTLGTLTSVDSEPATAGTLGSAIEDNIILASPQRDTEDPPPLGRAG